MFFSMGGDLNIYLFIGLGYIKYDSFTLPESFEIITLYHVKSYALA